MSKQHRREKKSHSAAQRDSQQHPPNAPAVSWAIPPKKFHKEIAKAIRAGPYWEPQGIAHSMLQRAGALDVKDIAKELRRHVRKLNLTDEAALADELLSLIRRMVVLLNWCAEAGKLGDAPRSHETWPMNYAPDASKGASKWAAANELYRKFGCGKNAVLKRVAGQVDFENRWTELADCGVRAALLAKQKASAWVDEKIRTAKTKWHATYPAYGRTKIECDYYLCQDGQVIAWPRWAELSRKLPDKLASDNWPDFLPIVRELMRIYFSQDEERMLYYLNAAQPHDRAKLKEWDANVFNHDVMPRVIGALKNLAAKRE